MTPMTPFASLAGMINFQDFPAMEFTVSSLKKAYNGVGQYGPYTLHSGEITDGSLSHQVLFTIDGGADHLFGKRIRVEAGRDRNGKLCDLCMEEKEYPKGSGKMERSVKIGKRAKITILDGSTPSQVSSPSQPAATHPKPSAVAGNGIPVGESTVAERVDAWMKILAEVCRQTNRDMVQVWKDFSPSDLKEITTGISMSYKGQYGVYAPPYFGAEKQAPGRWQDFLYPSKPPRKLGEVPEIDLLRYVTWALSLKEDTVKPEQREVWENVMAMAKDKGWNTEEPVLKDDEDSAPW